MSEYDKFTVRFEAMAPMVVHGSHLMPHDVMSLESDNEVDAKYYADMINNNRLSMKPVSFTRHHFVVTDEELEWPTRI